MNHFDYGMGRRQFRVALWIWGGCVVATGLFGAALFAALLKYLFT